MDAVAKRMYQLLIQALRERDPEIGPGPVTVAEIYQELIPYRAVRERLGIELNSEYEHTLLRLLAGELGLLRLEPASARMELQQELDSPNPYVGIYRKFAACDVWITDEVAEAAPPRDTATADETPSRPAATSPQPDAVPALSTPYPTAPAEGVRSAAGQGATSLAISAPSPRSAAASGACAFCDESLPTGRDVRFCPHCGKDQRLRPCSTCGEPLEPQWRFCIACGSTVTPRVTAGFD